MTTAYYTRTLLPGYDEAVRKVEAKLGWALLPEDGDPSHDMRENQKLKNKGLVNVAKAYRLEHNINNIRHPGQSPDLNAKEGVWSILFNKTRRER